MEEDNVKMIRFKLYMDKVFPIDLDKIKDIDLSPIDLTKNQVFIYKEDIHREVFSQLLLNACHAKKKKVRYDKVTLNNLIEHHFDPTHPTSERFMIPTILLIVYSTPTLENKIYGPILDKIIEDRRALGKRTYLFYKGVVSKFNTLKCTTLDEIVDLNINNRTHRRREDII